LSLNKRLSFKHLQSGGQLGRARSIMSKSNENFMGEKFGVNQGGKMAQVNRVRAMIRRRAMIITETNLRSG